MIDDTPGVGLVIHLSPQDDRVNAETRESQGVNKSMLLLRLQSSIPSALNRRSLRRISISKCVLSWLQRYRVVLLPRIIQVTLVECMARRSSRMCCS